MEQENVKVRVRFVEVADWPGGETMWARPVRAHDGGGSFELCNTSFYVPLAVRDVVRAELDGYGIPQVTGIVCPGPFVMSWAECSPGQDAAAIGDRWRDEGANWSEGAHGMLSTVWNEGVSPEQVRGVLNEDMHRGLLSVVRVIPPHERVGSVQDRIDFRLDREPPPSVTTSYWAADDPFWRAHGLDHPDFLAYVQALAGEDQVIATALEVGDYEAVRAMLAFLNDGPLW